MEAFLCPTAYMWHPDGYRFTYPHNNTNNMIIVNYYTHSNGFNCYAGKLGCLTNLPGGFGLQSGDITIKFIVVDEVLKCTYGGDRCTDDTMIECSFDEAISKIPADFEKLCQFVLNQTAWRLYPLSQYDFMD